MNIKLTIMIVVGLILGSRNYFAWNNMLLLKESLIMKRKQAYQIL